MLEKDFPVGATVEYIYSGSIGIILNYREIYIKGGVRVQFKKTGSLYIITDPHQKLKILKSPSIKQLWINYND